MKRTIKGCIVAALLARGEVEEPNSTSRYVRFTRKFKAQRTPEGALVAVSRESRWFIGRAGALHLGTTMASKGRTAHRNARLILINEGLKVLDEKEVA